MVEALQKLVERGPREQEWTFLIRRAAQGDQAALGDLYDATSQFVYSLAMRILSDSMVAEEVCIDVYQQVWRQAMTYDPQRGSPLSWLLTLTRSRAIDRLRSSRQQREREEPLTASDEFQVGGPEEEAIAAERRRLVQKALAALKPEQREPIEMAYFLGLSQSEIADRLRQPLGTIKTRIRLGMTKLRDMLLPLEEAL
jgi:RNA polymerase sigma-70 factor (ECF subfamily)